MTPVHVHYCNTPVILRVSLRPRSPAILNRVVVVFQGEWASGKPHGQGTATHKDGEKYVGTYKAGLYHGEGEIWYPQGNLDRVIADRCCVQVPRVVAAAHRNLRPLLV